MADRPILFSAPMVRALLAGTKTQTRRIAMSREEIDRGPWLRVRGPSDEHGWQVGLERFNSWKPIKVRIAVGDRLYVREHWRTWAQYDDVAPRDLVAGAHVAYEATESPNLGSNPGRFRQGMHMPRWASRITLHVTDVRVQRLQEISEEDAVAEGCPGRRGPNPDFPDEWDPSPVEEYRDLWNTINGSGSWDTNPWVAAYTFTVELANIDQARAAA